MPSPSDTKAAPALVVDRIACTGHGICASLLTDEVTLDEWGYPVVHTSAVDPELGDIAVRLCPARALAWTARTRLVRHTEAPQRASSSTGRAADF